MRNDRRARAKYSHLGLVVAKHLTLKTENGVESTESS